MLEFRMPQFGMGMTDGTIIGWLKSEGDTIVAGELLVEVEAAKTTVEVSAPASGVLSKILVPVDANVPVNTVIALIAVEDGTALPAHKETVREEADVPPQAPKADASIDQSALPSDKRALREEAGVPPETPRASPLAKRAAERDGVDLTGVEGSGARGKVMSADVARAAALNDKVQIEPRARRAAKELGVNLSQIAGTGPNCRIVEEDVRDFTARTEPALEPELAETASSGGRVEKHSAMRRTIARRLTEAKQSVPHFYLRANCLVDLLLALRADINAGQDQVKVSVNDFVVRAVGLALKRVEGTNLSWTDEGMVHHDSVDVAVAVAAAKGLVTPIVRQVDTKPILALSQEIKALAERGRAGKLSPDEYEGGSSSVSNLAMYGTEEFSAIINPPQASIFAVGAAEERPVIRDGAVVAATMMTVTLSVDHRAIDGAVAAELLTAFKSLIERPALILA